MIKAILACDAAGGVSKDGTLPWPHNSTDLKWFKENTKGHVVVMGSTTWVDPHMPCPLPLRTNVLVTSQQDKYPGADIYLTGDLAVQLSEVADKYPGLITWVIGGPNIVKQTLDVIDEFYLSRIPGEYDCDTFLPLELIESQFERTYVSEHPDVTFEVWRKHA